MGNVLEIFNEFKTKVEKEQFLSKQHETISILLEKNKELTQEIIKLKQLLTTPVVERVILTPEEALIETQIQFIHERSYTTELTLEEVKKLDLLIKNKKIIKEQQNEITIQAESKNLDKKDYSNIELIQLASTSND